MSSPSSEGKSARKPSIVRSVLPITLFLLLAGIVGPIFLVVGLSVRDEPDAGWLIPTGIGITLLDLAIGITIGMVRYRSAERSYRLHQRGRRGWAEVLNVSPTSVTINDQPVMELHLRLAGDDLASFEVTKKMVVPVMDQIALGEGPLPALIDPETREWEIDWARARSQRVQKYAAPAAGGERSSAERLAELDELLRKDLVSRDEYDAKRTEILDDV